MGALVDTLVGCILLAGTFVLIALGALLFKEILKKDTEEKK